MTFLNEVADMFPTAVSLAAGRPTERFFDRLKRDGLSNLLARYESHAACAGHSPEARAHLLQYGRTAGIIGDLIVQQLGNDDGVNANTDRVIVTSGCQEALALCLPALCPNKNDLALVCNPTYVGFTCAARAAGIGVATLPNGATEIAEAIEYSVRQLRRDGGRVRVVYLIPNFDNPTGRVLNEQQRKAILDVCGRMRIVVLEDNAYGMFQYDGQQVRPMSALDQEGCVLYLTTFSKTIAPTMRVGALTMPKSLFGDEKARTSLWNELVQRKSFLTLNTSQITQAIVGGLLLQEKGSLKRWIQPSVDWYRNNRNMMLRQLEEVFAPIYEQVQWNCPMGGFFLALDIPFRFDADAALECATKNGVVVMPMRFCALDNSQDKRVRLAFSSADPEQICIGIKALGTFIASRLNANIKRR